MDDAQEHRALVEPEVPVDAAVMHREETLPAQESRGDALADQITEIRTALTNAEINHAALTAAYGGLEGENRELRARIQAQARQIRELMAENDRLKQETHRQVAEQPSEPGERKSTRRALPKPDAARQKAETGKSVPVERPKAPEVRQRRIEELRRKILEMEERSKKQ